MRDNFERFGNYLSIDVTKSSISNSAEFCYIAPVVLNKIGRINVVFEGFVITENHDAYTFILESLFQMSSKRSKENVHAIFADEFMTQNILDSIGMNKTRIFYDYVLFCLKECSLCHFEISFQQYLKVCCFFLVWYVEMFFYYIC